MDGAKDSYNNAGTTTDTTVPAAAVTVPANLLIQTIKEPTK